jgi:hypothetical protein
MEWWRRFYHHALSASDSKGFKKNLQDSEDYIGRLDWRNIFRLVKEFRFLLDLGSGSFLLR